jgi:MFS family permease
MHFFPRKPALNNAGAAPSPSAFHYKLFRALWLITVLANVSIWMQNVGAGWVMISISDSPLMVALVQTATTLPMLLFGLPAGVMADLLDRRRLLLVTHVGMMLASAAMAALSYLGRLDAWPLLWLMFAVGSCSAFAITARQVSISDVVPRTALVHALALNSIAYNGARAVGPALAGIALTWLGTGHLFALVAVLFAVTVVMQAYLYTPPPKEAKSTERAIPAMRAGLRYVWHAPMLHAYFVRSVMFVLCASSLWALLPVLARDQLGFGATGYGLLLGCMGVGAVASGALLKYLRRRYSLNLLAAASGLVFAAVTLVAALVPVPVIVCIALTAAGAAWVVNNSTLAAAVQTALPAWVRARAISIYLLVFQGAMALGGAVWGAVAAFAGTSATLTVAGALAIAGVMYTRRYPVKLGAEADVTPSLHSTEPLVWTQPEPDDGPVAIQIEYHVAPEQQAEFIDTVHALGTTRRRDGASHWQLYQDLNDSKVYVERFMVYSWAEHLRQQSRATVTDRIAEERVRRLHSGEQEIKVARFLAQPRTKA